MDERFRKGDWQGKNSKRATQKKSTIGLLDPGDSIAPDSGRFDDFGG